MTNSQPETPEQREVRLRTQLASLQKRSGELLGRLSFAGLIEQLEQRSNQSAELSEKLARARSRGYTWYGNLEDRLNDAKGRAPAAIEKARAEASSAAQLLRARVDRVAEEARTIASRGAMSAQEAPIATLDGEVSGLRSAIDDAERRIRACGTGFVDVVEDVDRNVRKIEWTLDQFESASFKMVPEESPLFAIKAVWEDAPNGKTEGLLLLTDHRIRFEKQEERVLERTFLIFASKKETVKTLLLDEPLGHVDKSEDARRGWVLKDEMLTLAWARAAKAPSKTTFEVKDGTAKAWDDTIEMLKTGDIERARYTGELSRPSMVGVPVSWPEKCAGCGAGLTPPVKGQTSIQCQFCQRAHDVVLGQE